MAGTCSFLYMFTATCVYHGLSIFYQTDFLMQFIVALVLALLYGLASFALFSWNNAHSYNSLLYGLPMSILLAETFALCVYLAHGHVYLLPLLIDMGGSIIFMPIFWKRVNNKLLYLISTILLAILLYLIFYASSF